MLTFDYNPGLSKEKILSSVTEQEIIEFFIESKIDFKKPILSPFREEKSPSFTFKRVDNKIIFRDWGSGLYGDAFKFVQILYACNFNECLYIIDNKMNLGITNTEINMPLVPKIITPTTENSKTTTIQIEEKPWTLGDYKYWKQYEISLQTLKQYDVKSCRYVWLNGNLYAKYSNGYLIYAYKFYDGIVRYKIYKPLANKKDKWLSNTTSKCIEGLNCLNTKGDLLIITKSLKDVMCLRELNYDAISLRSENNNYDDELHNIMKERFSEIIIFYDNDETGRKNSEKISQEKNIREIFIPDKYNAKDISDFISLYGFDKAKRLITRLI